MLLHAAVEVGVWTWGGGRAVRVLMRIVLFFFVPQRHARCSIEALTTAVSSKPPYQ